MSIRQGFFLALSTAILSLTVVGCDAEGLEVPVSFESPAYEFSVTEHVEEYEDDMCADAESKNCKIIEALDRTDDGEVSNPPRIPAEFPKTVDVEECDAAGCVTVPVDLEEWAESEGLNSILQENVTTAIEIDLTAEVEADIESPDVISNVDISAAAIAWKLNTLTFGLPSIDIYMGNGLLGEDADALLVAEDVAKVGTLAATAAGSTSDTDLNFTSGGSDIFKSALQNLKFTVVLSVPATQIEGLAESSDGSSFIKPQGDGEVALKAEITYTVTAGDVQGGLGF
ncbi:MAG: hypothetical protein GY822_30130 [Deltaproteobacteria bacterium]|nr:hypothetical protein [Deltaproteobacteria bacterium]